MPGSDSAAFCSAIEPARMSLHNGRASKGSAVRNDSKVPRWRVWAWPHEMPPAALMPSSSLITGFQWWSALEGASIP